MNNSVAQIAHLDDTIRKIPNDTFRFGLSMLKEKEKLTPTTKEYPHSEVFAAKMQAADISEVDRWIDQII